jgi:hypothetical protein
MHDNLKSAFLSPYIALRASQKALLQTSYMSPQIRSDIDLPFSLRHKSNGE